MISAARPSDFAATTTLRFVTHFVFVTTPELHAPHHAPWFFSSFQSSEKLTERGPFFQRG
jgi:hypothetical protein